MTVDRLAIVCKIFSFASDEELQDRARNCI